MFFLLSKLLLFLFSPVFWVLVLLASAWAARQPSRRRGLLGASLLLALGSTSSPLADAALRAWEMPPKPLAALPAYDAGILLTGLGDGRQRPLTRPANAAPLVSRVASALYLYQTKHITRILISGGSGDLTGEGQISEARQLAQLLEAAGVPPAKILVEECSRNTRENALFTRQLLVQHPDIQSMMLITSAYHQRRALACFQRVGLYPTPFPTDYRTTAPSPTPGYWIQPNRGALRRWHLLLREVAGYWIYKALGYC